jgi:hypothetical protein
MLDWAMFHEACWQADPSLGALVGCCYDRNLSVDFSPSPAAVVRT